MPSWKEVLAQVVCNRKEEQKGAQLTHQTEDGMLISEGSSQMIIIYEVSI